MAYNLKQEMSKPERFVGGHRLCAGCGAGIACRAIMRALDPGDKAVISNATSCLEVSSFLYQMCIRDSPDGVHAGFVRAVAGGGGENGNRGKLEKRG